MPSISADDAGDLTGLLDALPVSALPPGPAPASMPLELLFAAPAPAAPVVVAQLPAAYDSLDASGPAVQLIGGGDFTDVLWRCLL